MSTAQKILTTGVSLTLAGSVLAELGGFIIGGVLGGVGFILMVSCATIAEL